MNLSLATPADIPRLTEATRQYLTEQAKLGGTVLLTPRTLDFYRDLLRSYLMGSLFGTVVIAEDPDRHLAGFALAGEPTSPPSIDTSYGKMLVVWLVWVAPEHRQSGLGLKMLLYGQPYAVSQGFETAVMHVREGNPMGQGLTESFGATPHEQAYLFDLSRPGGQPSEVTPHG